MFTDTHAHLHHSGLEHQIDEVIARAREAGVTRLINVGCAGEDSARAVEVAEDRADVWATIGLHPHDADKAPVAMMQLRDLSTHPKVVGIGECGLDYFQNPIPPNVQERAFRAQIELALEFDLPMVWHVRDAFDDFYHTVDDFKGLRGVVHCFTGDVQAMERAVERGFMVALGGIMTFTKVPDQLEAAKRLPLKHLVLETDCPFLAPAPVRGQTNEPAFMVKTAEFLARLRDESLDELGNVTTDNAKRLFGI